MGLNFVEEGEGFGSLFGDNPVTVTGYRSPESGQLETLKHYDGTGSGYNTVYRVTEGKTFNISHIIFSNPLSGSQKMNLAIGEAAEEINILYVVVDGLDTMQCQFQVPIQIKSNTRISFRTPGSSNNYAVSLVGFEE